MDRRFRVLRIIGTLWKVLAWVALIAGILASLGVLVLGLLGSGAYLLPLLGEELRGVGGAWGLIGGFLGFLVALVISVVYFLILYAAGELIYLLLAIEGNTRQMTRLREQPRSGEGDHPGSPSTASP